MKPNYQTKILNDQGLYGRVKVSNGNDFVTSSPQSGDKNNNPEQFIGAALATCLNATLEYLNKEENLPQTSSVEVTVDQYLDIKGYKFKLDASVKLPDVSRKKAKELLEEAEKRCPVAKLLTSSGQVNVHLE
ncbi:OsmC family protein [Companilactobacillus sp. DQM5]|uniref:OsmC family protein n=1 Tax=Companilactobacillus sp. DQM5 TaxID=3463359 RepID=UPI004059A7F5